MEIKKEANELKLINDINMLSLDELRAKYLKDEATYNKFVEDYALAFRHRLNYQLRIADQYDSIYRIFKEGIEKYPSDHAIDRTADMVNMMAYVRDKYAVNDAMRSDDKYQAHALFFGLVGADRIKHSCPTYEEVVNGIYSSCYDYENRGEDEITNYLDFMREVVSTSSNIDDVKREIERYQDEHPLCKRCNDLSYLYFVNYMLKQQASQVDEEFLYDAEDIIIISKMLNKINDSSRKEKSDYSRVARYTLRNIRSFRKTMVNDTKKEIKEQKKLINQFTRFHI